VFNEESVSVFGLDNTTHASGRFKKRDIKRDIA
jgi:hypothetical protein